VYSTVGILPAIIRPTSDVGVVTWFGEIYCLTILVNPLEETARIVSWTVLRVIRFGK